MKTAAITKQNNQVLPPGSRLWTPYNFDHVITWLSPLSNSSKTVGDGLDDWSDSLNNTQFIQVASNRQPTLTQEKATFNNLLVPDFDGGDDLMVDVTPTNLLDIGTGDFFIMAAIKTGVVGASSILNLQKESDNEQINFGIISGRGGAKLNIQIASLANQSGDTTLTNNTIYLVYCERLNGTLNVYLNGTKDHSLGLGNSTSIDNNGRSILGASNSIVPADTFDGKIAEVVFGGSTDTNIIGTEDRQRLEGYMAHNCGIADNLPSDHPYKNGPPRL